MRLVRLSKEPIRVEGKYGVAIIRYLEGGPTMAVHCIPDSLCIAQHSGDKSEDGILTLMYKKRKDDSG